MTRLFLSGVFAGLLGLVAGCQSTDGSGCGCAACSACGCGACGCGANACGCGGCGCGAATEVSSEDARHAMRLFQRYEGWKRLNDRPFRSKTHENHMVTDYANALGVSTFRSGRGEYPVGAVVVKAGTKAGKRTVWFMEKRAPGYDGAHGDWWYGTVKDGDTVANAGRVGSCIQCHEGADNDYVYGLP